MVNVMMVNSYDFIYAIILSPHDTNMLKEEIIIIECNLPCARHYSISSCGFVINPGNDELIVYTSWRLNGLFQFEIIINVLVSFSTSLEYLCYGSTAIINIFTLTVRGSTLDVRI